MVLELHVWGPAFSLPSIEAQSLAAITYFVLAVPKDEWVLVPSSDPSVSPTNELPALKNGTTWVSRFRNIVDYLRQYSSGEWDLDRWLTGLDKADNTAFASFTESRGQALIDLSLFVSSQNYYESTSPAYGTILAWPNMWIAPPKLREAAKKRTEHLGLSSLDLDEIEEQKNREKSATAAGKIPKSLITRPRDTVSSLLGRTPKHNRFKLEALTAEFFEPLEELLGNKSYLLSDEHPTSLDCLVIGLLSLALVPELPYPWLRESLQAKAPRLAEYTERMRRRCFGLVDFSSVFEQNGEVSPLPWQVPERVTVSKIGSTLLSTLADSTPILKDLRANDRLREAAKAPDSGFTADESKAISEVSQARKRDVYISIATVAAGITAFVGYLFHVGLIQVDFGGSASEVDEEEDGVETSFDLGPLGDALSGL